MVDSVACELQMKITLDNKTNTGESLYKIQQAGVMN